MFDRENVFSLQQAVTATADSDDIVYIGEGDAGPGRPLMLEIDASDNTGGASITVAVNTADTDDMAGAVTIATFTIDAATLAKGGPVLSAAIPRGCKRFLRLNYDVTGTPVGLALTAGILPDTQTNR